MEFKIRNKKFSIHISIISPKNLKLIIWLTFILTLIYLLLSFYTPNKISSFEINEEGVKIGVGQYESYKWIGNEK